ncbi:hypothetical protein [Uliginosibacterium gangwonense]|uniref:hypothetical protein n=1 Tax=Uliginosibacterium gangwonense TaxID=392736 RepID=UPI00036417A1|nr:hypothetical protein [Uliginosibacterium gangwonense]
MTPRTGVRGQSDYPAVNPGLGNWRVKAYDDLESHGIQLRGNQDALIVAVTKPGQTIVVLKNGTPRNEG